MNVRNLPPLPFMSERRIRIAVLGYLLLLGGLAIAGPTGLLAWGENERLLEQRHLQVAKLEARQADLENKVRLLDPDNADPDLVGELLRERMGVAHPDEIVVELDR